VGRESGRGCVTTVRQSPAPSLGWGTLLTSGEGWAEGLKDG
jgi:hypothetical protein